METSENAKKMRIIIIIAYVKHHKGSLRKRFKLILIGLEVILALYVVSDMLGPVATNLSGLESH